MSFLGLLILLVLILALPLSIRYVEQELEGFLFAMSLLALTLSGQWSLGLVKEALREPLSLTLSVLLFGLFFQALRTRFASWIQAGQQRLGLRGLAFVLVAGTGFFSAFLTSVIAALILAEALPSLNVSRKSGIRLVILGCSAIGLGSMLSPAGGPLSVIAMQRMQGGDFFFLARQLGTFILPLLLLLGLGVFFVCEEGEAWAVTEAEGLASLLSRCGRLYFFIVALVFLGSAFSGLAETYAANLTPGGIYWLNLLSAVLDNATLAAAELSPHMDPRYAKFALLGLGISGCMLVPGNIPNMICAARLQIKAKEWALFGLPLGLALMAGVFLILN